MLSDDRAASVTFKTLAEQFRRAGGLDAVLTAPMRAFRASLFSAEKRDWFRACACYATSDLDPEVCENVEWREFLWKEFLSVLGDDRSVVAHAHVACAEAARQARRADGSAEKLLQAAGLAVANFVNARENFVRPRENGPMEEMERLPPGAHPDYPGMAVVLETDINRIQNRDAPRTVDAAFRLLTEARGNRPGAWLQGLAEAWDVTRDMLGAERPAERLVTVRILVVEEIRDGGDVQRRGHVKSLALELVPDGLDVLYPAPEMAFVSRPRVIEGGAAGGTIFAAAEDNASAYVRRLGLWRPGADVRSAAPEGDAGPAAAAVPGRAVRGRRLCARSVESLRGRRRVARRGGREGWSCWT